MLSAVLGTLIMSAITTALLLGVEFSEKVFNQAGKYPIRKDERKILQNANLLNQTNIDLLQGDINILPRK